VRLVELRVTHLPGVDAPFHVSDLAPGVTVVVGPNASGKSSMVRALRALWSSEVHSGDVVDVRAEFRQRTPDGAEVKYRASRVGATITWERDGLKVDPPPTPPEHLLNSYLISIETLMRSGRTDTTIGDLLRREMTGGYDLKEARTSLVTTVKGHRGASFAFREAQRGLEKLERERRLLSERQAKRGELLQERARAEALAQEAHKYDLALALHGHLAELERAKANLEAMPEVLERLTGHEGQELAALREEHAKAAERREAASRALADARAALRDTGMAEVDLDRAAAASLQAAAAELQDLEKQVASNQLAMAERLTERSGPWKRLGGQLPDPAESAFDAGTLNTAEDLLGERLAAGVRLDAVGSELRQLQAAAAAVPDEPADGDAQLTDEELATAQANLASWLAEPPRATAAMARSGPPVGPSLLLALSAVLFLVSTVLALRTGGTTDLLQRALGLGPALYLPAAGGVIALLAGLVWWLASRDRGVSPEAVSAHRAYEVAYGRTGAREPAQWHHTEVAQRLGELHAEAATRRAAAERLAAQRSRANDLARELDDARERVRAAEERLTSLARATGYSWSGPEAMRADFTAWLRDVKQVHDLTAKLQALHAARAKLEERADALYHRVREGLAGTPFELTDPLTGPARWHEGEWRGSKVSAAAALRVLTDRAVDAVAARDEARAHALQAEKDLREAGEAEAAATAKRDALLVRCGLDPTASEVETRLHALLAQRPEYLAARKEIASLETLVGNARASLADAPHILEAAYAESPQALEEGKARAKAAKDVQNRISSDIGALDLEVSKAESGRDLEAARALLERTEREVAERLRSAHLNVAFEVLLDDIEQEHEVKRQPELLQRAQAWFSRFTHGAFALEFDPTAPSHERLRARDVAQDSLLVPEQLSTGTRAQLLLALRVSHAASAEGDGVKLPFFLDEALTTADSARFREVAASLLELAETDGRQIIYLSARREDARSWLAVAEGMADTLADSVADSVADAEKVKVIDLAEVRSLEPPTGAARSASTN